MYKKYKWGKTIQVYVPKEFSEELKAFIRVIDTTQNPKGTLESLTELINKLGYLDR